jgi:hypothetical protein
LLTELLHPQSSRLGRFLHKIVDRDSSDDGAGLCGSCVGTTAAGSEWYFHDFSSLVADPGCKHQPLHRDIPFRQLPPLFTVFVALQDVQEDMGPTVLVPASHRLSIAEHKWVDPNLYRRALLRKGDCIVMDARTWHFGSANNSGGTSIADGAGAARGEIGRRQVLFYFSLRNPAHADYATDENFPRGSIFEDLEGTMKMSDFVTASSTATADRANGSLA